MYRAFMSKESSSFIAKALLRLAEEVRAEDSSRGFWVCYGSFVLNQQTPESDLDLLYIHNRPATVQRIQSFFEGRPVTVYTLSRNDFISDGKQLLFGGYFSGKALNPYSTFLASQEDEDMVAEVSGAFIGPFAARIAKALERDIATRANLVADSVLARFHLCPWYRSYFLRYYITPVFPQLWARMEEVIPSSLVKAGIVAEVGNGFRYCCTLSDNKCHEKVIMAVARFWALGSCLHGGMPDFPSFYMQKAEQFINHNNLEDRSEEMMRFLHNKSYYPKEREPHVA